MWARAVRHCGGCGFHHVARACTRNPLVRRLRMSIPRTGVAEVVVPVLVRDLTPTDLPACTWSGSTAHLMQVERELVRAAAGDVDYLAVCTPVDVPVAIGGIWLALFLRALASRPLLPLRDPFLKESIEHAR